MSDYTLYKSERDDPTPEADRANVRMEFINKHGDAAPAMMSGFWRIVGAKTKADYPVAIYTQEGITVFAIGGQRRLLNTRDNATEWSEFTQSGWLKSIAVVREDWAVACDTGFWLDGKPARLMSKDEKLGIGTEQGGGNDAPVEETLADQIATLAEKASAAEVTDQASADAATGILDRLRRLLELAEAERVKEKEPHLRAGQEVDDRWKKVRGPGLTAGEALKGKRTAWLKAEQVRLNAEAEAARIQAEKEAKAKGEEPPVVEPKRATAGTSYGRQSGLKKVKVAKIVDLPMLVNALVFAGNGPDADAEAYFQSRADKALRAGITLPGVEIVVEER